jgi:hypothetical protein
MVQQILDYFSSCVVDSKDNQPYHSIFSEEKQDGQIYFYLYLQKLSKSNLWISTSLCDELNKLNLFFVKNGINLNSIEDGKKNYNEIGDLRDDLLIITKKDILKLYKINHIKRKKISKGMRAVRVNKKWN